MHKSRFHSLRGYRRSYLFWTVGLAIAALILQNCGGSTRVELRSNPPVGSAAVSMSDPPSCKVPNGTLKSVFVTVRGVQAHTSASATGDMAGWQDLATQLATQPVQMDLLATPQNSCILAQLGSNSALPVGDYQQIRLLLLSNTPAASDPRPATNACGSEGFNCAVLADNSIHRLELSSQANTGLKIPPGQIVGGPIRVEDGKHVDINIDFNACASMVLDGTGQYRLKPALTAGQVSTNTTGIGGQVVDSATGQAIAGKVLVAVEQVDGSGVDRVVMQAAADANGNFNFCPLAGGTYDVIAVAISNSGVAYNATVAVGVASGTSLGKIPLVAETGATPGPGTLQGRVTATTGTAGASVLVGLSALQTITLPGTTTTRQVTIPLQADSTPSITTEAGTTCPTNTNCKPYKLVVPASNPSVGAFSSSGTTFAAPAAGDVLFTVEGRAANGDGTARCSPSRLTTDKDSTDQPLKVTGGATLTAKQMDFTGCS